MMKLSTLGPSKGARMKPKRVGRGPGSGHGKTSTRGHKGQKSRSGGGVRPGFEGGQMPLQRRLPKVGFKNFNRKVYNVVNIGRLNKVFNDGELIDPQILLDKGIIKKLNDGLKILGMGNVSKKLTVRAHKLSKTAREKIEAAGGKVEVI